ncbi:HipA domain-containing protein [Chitinimonas koreensis]|uniref:HipA domain-containing protein n=1 Tax=Chitinimonas koreensis TaxID=356302 RepID=UPI000A069D6D|nr:HipA domain-containing protein [Chitinimonas koreensis]
MDCIELNEVTHITEDAQKQPERGQHPSQDRLSPASLGQRHREAAQGHPRNHAAIYRHQQRRWRLAPAFDVVPNPVETPATLSMGIDVADKRISRGRLCANPRRFGFDAQQEIGQALDDFLAAMRAGLADYERLLPTAFRAMTLQRITVWLGSLGK